MENLYLSSISHLWDNELYIISYIVMLIGLAIVGIRTGLGLTKVEYSPTSIKELFIGITILVVGVIIFGTTYDSLHTTCILGLERMVLRISSWWLLILGIILLCLAGLSTFKLPSQFSFSIKFPYLQYCIFSLGTWLIVGGFMPMGEFKERPFATKDEMESLFNEYMRNNKQEKKRNILSNIVSDLSHFELVRETKNEKLEKDTLTNLLDRIGGLSIYGHDTLKIRNFDKSDTLCKWNYILYSMGYQSELEMYLNQLALSKQNDVARIRCNMYLANDCTFIHFNHKDDSQPQIMARNKELFLDDQFLIERKKIKILSLSISEESGLVDTLKYIQ